MILLALSYVFWLIVRKKVTKKQKIVIIIAALLLGYLSLVPVTLVVEPGDDSAEVFRGAPSVVFVNTPYSFYVFFISWLLIYVFRDRRS